MLSRTGFVLFYAGCPLVWASRIQSIIGCQIRIYFFVNGNARSFKSDAIDGGSA